MARPQWITQERLESIVSSCDTIPADRMTSRRDYKPPRTLESDFKRLLEHEVPHTNFTFELIHDWYAAQETNYSKIYVRGQLTPIDWKSKIGNSDMSVNFKTSYDHTIYKGDYVLRDDGRLYILSWNVTNHPNNQATQATICNDYLTFTREHIEKTDANGFLIDDDSTVERDDDGRDIIVKNIPSSHSEYAGRPEYSVAQNQPGVTANDIVNIYMQWNSQTKNIQIDDTFKILNVTYIVQNVYTGETDINHEHGTLYIQSRRLPGGTSKYGR